MSHDQSVRESSPRRANRQIDERLRGSVQEPMTDAQISRRLRELDREWDIERTLEANAASVAMLGIALAAVKGKRWLILPGAVGAFLLQHAVQGWCPPLPVFRMLGVRTREEIDTERYALKALRGDFRKVRSGSRRERAARALEAASRKDRSP